MEPNRTIGVKSAVRKMAGNSPLVTPPGIEPAVSAEPVEAPMPATDAGLIAAACVVSAGGVGGAAVAVVTAAAPWVPGSGWASGAVYGARTAPPGVAVNSTRVSARDCVRRFAG